MGYRVCKVLAVIQDQKRVFFVQSFGGWIDERTSRLFAYSHRAGHRLRNQLPLRERRKLHQPPPSW